MGEGAITAIRQPPESEENPNSTPPQSPIEPPGWEKPVTSTFISELTDSQQSPTQPHGVPRLEKKVSPPTEVDVVDVRHSKKPRSSKWDKMPSPPTESQSLPPPPTTEQSLIKLQTKNPEAAALQATGCDVGQMVCGSCNELVSYPRWAKLVKCPCCETANVVFEEDEYGTVKCGKCCIWLMYPNVGESASLVRCSTCRLVTEIGDQSRRPPP